jgi:PAS domain S-box-containing protein
MDSDPVNTSRDAVIKAFKTFAFRIFEVSRDEKITNVWAGSTEDEERGRALYLGLYASDINNDTIIRECVTSIRTVFRQGKAQFFEYNITLDGKATRFPIKILPASYSSDFILVIVERSEVKEVTEDRWRLALDAVGDGIWDVNLQTRRIFFSSKWEEIFGYSQNEIVTTEQWAAKIHPEDLLASQKAMEDHVAGKTPVYASEIRFQHKDGSYRWILSRGVVTAFSDDGKPLRFIGTHKDIHKKKLEDLAHLEDKKRYKIIFDYSLAAICTHDLEGNVLNVNPYATALLQYSYDELKGRNIADLVPEKFRSEVQVQYLDVIKKKTTAEGVLSILAGDGSIKHLLYKNYVFSNPDGEQYVIAFAQDISDRMHAEAELRASEKTFSTYFNLSGTGMAVVSPEGKWNAVNDALCKMLGYTREELFQLTFQDITYPEDLGRDLHLMKNVLNNQADSYHIEKRYITKSGRVIWVLLTTSIVRDAQSQPLFFISQLVDITARKDLTNELRSKNIELNSAKEKLLSKVKELEEISHAIAHNLRGPAKNINLLTRVLNVKCGRVSDHEDANILAGSFTIDELASLLDTVGLSMTNSLETLLTIAEIRLNREVPFDDCDFEEAIDSVVDQLAGDILKKNINIQRSLGVGKIYYPRPYLESILYNLVSNAVKYCNPLVASKIWISTNIADGGAIALQVRDNGFGIDMAKYGDKIFKLNQVFHKGMDSKGVGLYLTKTQIESLGGSIHVESIVNEGSTFTVVFRDPGTKESALTSAY